MRLPPGAFSANTERAVRADLGVFAAWCGERGRVPMPARAETIARLRRRHGRDARAGDRAALRGQHRRWRTGAVDRGKAARSAAVKLALKRMHRRKGRRQAQARGLTWPLRERLIDAAGDRAIDDRNRALVAVAYDAMLRRSELADLQVNDLIEEIDGSGTLLVRRGKTDPEGRGGVPLPGSGHGRAGARVATPRPHRGGPPVPLGGQGRHAGRGSSTRARCRASSRRWRTAPVSRRRSPTACPATARVWALCRTWSRVGSNCPRSCRLGAGRPRRW